MIKYPFGIISDVHCHDWSSFSYIREDKINSRLYDTLSAIRVVSDHIKKEGGRDLVVTGDLFHTRGKIKPSVFNPVYDLFSSICSNGINVHLIPGNHDLEGKDSDTIGNATFAFKEICGFNVYNNYTEVGKFIFIPWIEQKDDFVRTLGDIEYPVDKVVFCHIGIDGVLDGVSGKVGKAVLERGFKYVFAGDYHNHKFLGSNIYSVGALTHHNFGDINTTAGYLIVREYKVEHFETRCPKFVEGFDKRTINGNIVRLTGTMSEENAEAAIKSHYDYGAKFVQDLTTRPTLKDTTSRSVVIKVDLDINTAIDSYVRNKYGTNARLVLDEISKL